MKEFKSFIKYRKIELIISAIYVGIGTLAVCSIYPKDLFYGDWSLFVLIWTMPVIIFSLVYRYAEADNLKYFTDNIPNLLEVSIGHALISEALYLGLENTIQAYLKRLAKW